MPVTITCPGCRHSYRVSSKLIGQKARCKQCDHRFEIRGSDIEGRRPTSAPDDVVFAGMSIEDMLGQGSQPTGCQTPELPESPIRQGRSTRRAGVAEVSAPMPSMVIAGLGDTRSVKQAAPWRVVLPYLGSLGLWDRLKRVRLSPTGLLLVVCAISLNWAFSINAVDDPSKTPWWTPFLTPTCAITGVLLVLGGLLGFGQSPEGKYRRLPEVVGAIYTSIFTIGLMILRSHPDGDTSIGQLMLIIGMTGGIGIVAGNLWILKGVLQDNPLHLLGIWFVPFYGPVYVILHWRQQREGALLAIAGAAILGSGLALRGIAIKQTDMAQIAAQPASQVTPVEVPQQRTTQEDPAIQPQEPAVAQRTVPESKTTSSTNPSPLRHDRAEHDASAGTMLVLTSPEPSPSTSPHDGGPATGAGQHLESFLVINHQLRFRPPKDLTGRMDDLGRNGRWRGRGTLQRAVGLELTVRPRDKNMSDPVQSSPDGKKRMLRVHGQWVSLAGAQVDRLAVNGLDMVRARMAQAPNALINTCHYVAIAGDDVIAFTVRYDPSRPMQLDVLEASVLSLERASP